MLATEAITQATYVDIATMVMVGGLIAIVVGHWTSTKHRLDALEKAQESDNKWRAEQFAPFRRKMERFTDAVRLRMTEPDAAQSKGTWPKSDTH